MGCGWSSRGRRRLALAVLAAAPLLACEPASAPAPGGERAERVDRVERIVLVSIDTLRADHVGAYGAEKAETPTLDALAAEGTRFETAISPAPLTLPSHTTLLTGRDPPSHGVRHNGLFRRPPDVLPLAEHLRGAGFATAAFVSAFVLDARFGLDGGFDHYDDELGMLSGAVVSISSRPADRTIDAALAWLEHAPERFFLFVHLYDPHAPYDAPEPFASRFVGRPYDAEIAFADAQLGRLRSGIESRFAGGTLWAVTSDHGESLGEHDEPTHSYLVYDATQRVPLIAAGPGVPRGRVVSGVVALADVAPTLLELAELPALPGAGGASLAPALRDGGESPRRAAWVETLATQLDLGWSPLLGARTAAEKYVRAPEPELYELGADPKELRNLASQRRERAAELDRWVEEQLAVGRPVVPSFTPDAEERARLEALGYLRGAGPTHADPALGRVGGPDPKREMKGQVHVDAILTLLGERRGAEALAAYDRIPTPGFAVRLMGANAALLVGDFARAEREARAALELAQLPEPWIVIAKVQHHAGHDAEAKRSLERALALDPEKSHAWLGLGVLAEEAGKREEALELYERARALPNVTAEALWRSAALELEAGRRDAASTVLAQIPQAELRLPEAAQRLARAERDAGRPELARTRVDGALRAYPHVADLWLLKGDLLDQQGDLPGAMAARRKALDLAPSQPDAQNAVAWTLGRLGRNLAEADGLASRAIEQLGRTPALLDTLATVRVGQRRYDEALALADEGLAVATVDRVDLSFRRAEALAGLGRREEAEQALARARSEAESSPRAWSTWPEAERRVAKLLGAAS
jgi:arylsulfatase A-like enzyme/tetratricopeptide (TPR) repeat protein